MSEKIAFIGVGRMGSGMTGRLLAAGHQVTVYDPDPAAVRAMVTKGARGSASVREACEASTIVMASVPTPSIAKATAQEVLEAAAGGAPVQIFVDLSTSGPAAAMAMTATLAPAGIAAVDAPVSGGVSGAANGKLAIMVSGPAAATRKCSRCSPRWAACSWSAKRRASARR